MPSSRMDRPISFGAISKTSRSSVGLENRYTIVMTNPPMQFRRTSSCTAESSSPKKENHGSEMLLWGRVGKVFSFHVCEEIPVRCGGRAVLTQPHSFSLSHRVVAKGIFAHQLRTLQDFQRLRKLSRPLAAIPAFWTSLAENTANPTPFHPGRRKIIGAAVSIACSITGIWL